MEKAIEMKNVCLEIRSTTLLQDVSFELNKGEVCGVYGRNGAGKSLLMKVACGLIQPTRGEIKVWGKKVGENGKTAEDTGILIESPALLPDCSAYENLYHITCITHKCNINSKNIIRDTLLEFGINPDEKKPVRKYSLGMRQKVAIALAVFDRPAFLLLDEPSNNLDAESIACLHSFLCKQNRDTGTTILMASHQKNDFNALCSRVITIDHGKIIGDDKL